MGRGGSISWPGCSPELTPCDYFLSGYIKETVCQEALQNINELMNKIRQAVAAITQDTPQEIQANMKFRLCSVVRGLEKHFEHLLD